MKKFIVVILTSITSTCYAFTFQGFYNLTPVERTIYMEGFLDSASSGHKPCISNFITTLVLIDKVDFKNETLTSTQRHKTDLVTYLDQEIKSMCS